MSSKRPDSRTRILRSAWAMVERDGPEVSLAQIATEAGVSRQAVYLHFGSRAGLLLAAIRHHDLEAGLRPRFTDAVRSAPSGAEAARAWTRIWLDYLPEVAELASRLDAAAATDPAAREVLGDRMANQRRRLTQIFEWAQQEDSLRADLTPTRAAETLWSLVHVSAWRQLVTECGWSPSEFEQSRLALLDHTILSKPDNR